MRNRPIITLNRRGFSVTELLVVIVVSGILITSLFGMLKQDTEVQTCLDDQSSDLRRSRMAADLLFSEVVEAGSNVKKVPETAEATSDPWDYQPSYELLGPDFIVFNANVDPNPAVRARDVPITYDFLSAGTKTLPGPSLQMSRADSRASAAGVFGYDYAETIAYFLQTNDYLTAGETYGANDCTFTLYRQVNDGKPEIVQRGVRSYDYGGVLPGHCNGATAPAPTDRLPVPPMFTYWGHFKLCATPPCSAPQLWGDADNNGALSIAEYSAGSMASNLNFNLGDRYGGIEKVENTECVWANLTQGQGGNGVKDVFGCLFTSKNGALAAQDINGTGKIEQSLDEVVTAVNFQLTVESPQTCDNYLQNNGFVRNQISLTVRPPNPPLRGFSCGDVPHNLKDLDVLTSTATCDLECGRSAILEFPVSVDDPFYTGSDDLPDVRERDVVVYNIYAQINDTGNFSQIGSVAPTDTAGADYQYTVTGLDPSNKYTFKVKPADCSGNESPEDPLPPGYTQSPVTADLNPNPPNEPACAVPSATGMICAPNTVLLTWGYADPKPSTGTQFKIEILDASGNWIPATITGNFDITFDVQNGVADTQFRSGDCYTASAGGGPDCYFAVVDIPNTADNFQYRILPPDFSGCYCGNCNPVTTCDWCNPGIPVCQVLDDPCNPDLAANSLIVTWNSFELELCSGLASVPKLESYRLMRDYSGGGAIGSNQVIQNPALLTDLNHLVRELTEDAASGTCSLAPNSPVGTPCTVPAPGPYDAKGNPVYGANAVYPYPASGIYNAMAGCPTGVSGDPSDTEIQGASVDQCALTEAVNAERGNHRYMQIDYTGINACDTVTYALATTITLPMADLGGETSKFFVSECQGVSVPNQSGFESASLILSPDPLSSEAPYMGFEDHVGPGYLPYDTTLPDARYLEDMCHIIPSVTPSSPLISDPAQNLTVLGFQIAQPGVADPSLADVELIRYTMSLNDLPVLRTPNPDPGLPDAKVVDFSDGKGYEIEGSGWHDMDAAYSWPTLIGLERSHGKPASPVVPGTYYAMTDDAGSGDSAFDYHHAYNYRVFSVGAPYGCGPLNSAPRSCSYGYANYIPARPEPVFPTALKYDPVATNGIRFANDPAQFSSTAPAVNLDVSESSASIGVYGMSRSDCNYIAPDTCLIPDPLCEPVSYRWFRRDCDGADADPAKNCTGPTASGDRAIMDELDRLTLNTNILPVTGPYDASLIWDEIISGMDSSGNTYSQASGSFDLSGGSDTIVISDCDTAGEKFFYYTLVAERTVTLPDGTQRTLYSEPSPLIKVECEEQDDCETSCEPNSNDPYDNNWGMVCMNSVGDPTVDRFFRFQGTTYEMVLEPKTMKVTSYKHYNPDMDLPNPTGSPATSDVAKGHYEYVDQQSNIPLILAYDQSQKDENNLMTAGAVASGGPFIGGDDEKWRVISYTRHGEFEAELVAVFDGDTDRKVVWRFHPETVMVHIEWGGSNPGFFAVVNTSPNRGSSGAYDVATETLRPRNMFLSAPDNWQQSAACQDLGPDGAFDFRLDNWAGAPAGQGCHQTSDWETLRLGWRQYAVWSSAGYNTSGGFYDPTQASASLLAVEWQEMPSGSNQSRNYCNPNYNLNPATRWLYGSAAGHDSDGDCVSNGSIVKGETGRISRRNSKMGALLEPGCEVSSSVTSVRIPETGSVVSNPNFIDLIFRPMYKSQVTDTDGTVDLNPADLYDPSKAQYGATSVAISAFANRQEILVSDPSASDSNMVLYPNYLFNVPGSSPPEALWRLGLDNGLVSKTSADPIPTFTGGSQYFAEGRSLCYLPEWGGYVFQLRDTSALTAFRVEYDSDRGPDPLLHLHNEVEEGLFAGLPLAQPRFYPVKWNNSSANTAQFFVARDSDVVQGSCEGQSMTMFRNGTTQFSSLGGMGALMFTFNNRKDAVPVGWPLLPGTTQAADPNPVILRVTSGSRPDTHN